MPPLLRGFRPPVAAVAALPAHAQSNLSAEDRAALASVIDDLINDGLPRETLCRLIDRAGQIRDAALGRTPRRQALDGTTVCTLFFEPSTRTRSSFHIAAQRLGADVLNFDASTSSTRKGETACDTLKNLEAMGVRGFVVRHPDDGAVAALAAAAGEGTALINAGDGRHAHPTQGLLDMYTIRHYKKDFTQLSVAIVGDVLHSRVARSDIHALTTLGCPDVRVVGPRTLVPSDLSHMGVRVCHTLEEGVKGCDVVITLRLQNERMSGALLPSSQEYFKSFGLTQEKLQLAKPDAIVMHPGPINRGVEIDSAVVDGKQSVILPQVTFGIAVRMAVMSIVAGNEA